MRLLALVCVTSLILLTGALRTVADPKIIVLDSCVFAEYKNGAWRSLSPSFSATGPWRFRRVGIGSVGGTVTVKAVSDDPDTGIMTEPQVDGVAVGGMRPSVPRRVRSVSVTARHKTALAEHLRTQKIKYKSLRITKVYSVDLEGDGSNEELIQAGSRPNMGTKYEPARSGDYSVVLVLPSVGTRTALMYDTSFPRGRYEVMAVADMEGNGHMEVVVRQTVYEGMGAVLYGYHKGTSTPLATGGWML